MARYRAYAIWGASVWMARRAESGSTASMQASECWPSHSFTPVHAAKTERGRAEEEPSPLNPRMNSTSPTMSPSSNVSTIFSAPYSRTEWTFP
eukprot:CAMPEP_0196597652 /NCGR_PEP_ID=MMETSP1081-20130531/92389_1 /TAXON_ID=36882 /ORGANISM="Pyramimonas amylifera, Strain CCMP720" /LENGTH=92 /DNA_ID=CAMNT_0041923133 /DNA_START=57 /DNA_END=331 /DNA_ORIENTATION=-